MPGTAAPPSPLVASPVNQLTRSGGGIVRAIVIAASVSAGVGPPSRAAFASSSRAAAGSRARTMAASSTRSRARARASLAPAIERLSVSSAAAIPNLPNLPDPHSEPHAEVRRESDQADADSRQQPDRGSILDRQIEGDLREVELQARDAGDRDAGCPPARRHADAATEAEVPVEVEELRRRERRHLEQVVDVQGDPVDVPVLFRAGAVRIGVAPPAEYPLERARR